MSLFPVVISCCNCNKRNGIGVNECKHQRVNVTQGEGAGVRVGEMQSFILEMGMYYGIGLNILQHLY